MVKSGRCAFGDFRLDPANAVLRRGSDRLALAPKPFEVLCHLVERAGHLVTKEELIEAVWSGLHVSESSLSVSIKTLRSTLGDDPKDPRYIETVPRRGYRFIAPVTVSLLARAEEVPSNEPPAPMFRSTRRPHWSVGREASLEALTSLLARAVTGQRQVVFVTGEAGIGKTTLVDMLIESVSSRGVDILSSRCIEHFGADEAFLPLIEALEDRCVSADGHLLVEALRVHAPTWLAQMPKLLDTKASASLKHEVFGASRERMLREFCELVEVLAAQRPWVIIIDDLHWSDFATLDVLSRLARRDRKACVLVVATYRPIDVLVEGHPVRNVHQALEIHGRCTELALTKLSPSDVEQHLTLRFGEGEMIAALAGSVFTRTRGQPLFVVSLVDYFVAQSEIVEVDGKWRLARHEADVPTEGMPNDLTTMIACQIDRLSTTDQRFLEVASAAGVEFSAALVAGAVKADTIEVEQVCEALVRSGRILTAAGVDEWPDGTLAGRYSFQHALYQEVLYQRLAPGQRVTVHKRLGERLERGYGARAAEVAPILALHFEQGRDFPKAVHYLARAADNSTKRFGNREAAMYATRALDLVERLPPESRLQARMALLRQRGSARRFADDLAGAADDFGTLISCARDANDLTLEIRTLVDLSRFCIFVDRPRCLGLAETAVARTHDLDDGDDLKALARANYANLNLWFLGWRDRDAELCRQQLEIMNGSPDQHQHMSVVRLEMALESLSGNYARCREFAELGQKYGEEKGDVYFYMVSSSFASMALLYLGAWGELRKSLNATLAMAEKNANRLSGRTAIFFVYEAWLNAEALDFEGAIKVCNEGLAAGADEIAYYFVVTRNILTKANLGLRNYSAALDWLNEVRQRIEVDGTLMDLIHRYLYHHNACDYWVGAGNLDEARRHAVALRDMAALPPERTYLALAHRLLARIAILEGRIDEARTNLARAIAIVEQASVPLAAWRVYTTAADFHESLGETSAAAKSSARAREVIDALAATLDENDPLRHSFLKRCAAEARR